ncbi:unnamed protein product [Microthlaspi erraticum]|uniref:Uncharacterized protein n=1 Tax=Microthlaspi erraticum TaxID=1685480 RepID=A0A6D2IRJ9_9BRAS|nr:unnamed protein product [Microthlaspi erraticum]
MRSMRLFLLLALSALMLLGIWFTEKLISKGCSNSSLEFLKTEELSFPHGITQTLYATGMGYMWPQTQESYSFGPWRIATGRGDITILVIFRFSYHLVSNNSFGGTIPQELGNLFRLKDLNMFSNFLGGTIPARLSNCSRLLRLRVDSNDLGGRYSFRTRVIDKALCLYLVETT